MIWNTSSSGYDYMYINVFICIVIPWADWSNTLSIEGYTSDFNVQTTAVCFLGLRKT